VVRAGWDKIISDNLDTEREREREREVPAINAIPLSHLIIMAMFYTLQINVREEKASPSPQTPKSG
jgi:hypothetical protein